MGITNRLFLLLMVAQISTMAKGEDIFNDSDLEDAITAKQYQLKVIKARIELFRNIASTQVKILRELSDRQRQIERELGELYRWKYEKRFSLQINAEEPKGRKIPDNMWNHVVIVIDHSFPKPLFNKTIPT